MLLLPLYAIIDFNFIDFLGEAVTNGNGHPLPVLNGFDSIAILPFVFLILNVIQITKYVCFAHLIEIAEPWKILRLMNRDNQSGFAPK